jgi:uncharacterized membrane protein
MSHSPTAPAARLLSLDALRGLLMVLMALDHANQFIAHGKAGFELWIGPFPSYGSRVLPFLTRWITHLAAPGFILLLGVGMALFTARRLTQGWTRWRIARHLLLRGALLILLQFLVENPAWDLAHPYRWPVYVGVLYALGGCLIAGAGLIWLPTPWLVAGSAALLLAIEPLLTMLPTQRSLAAFLLLLPGDGPGVYVLYPLLPWLGVAGLGMVYGRWLRRAPERASRAALWLGLGALAGFALVRSLSGYGNLRPIQVTGWIAWLNVVKYPPSLAFLLLTLGLDLALLGGLARCALTGPGLRVLAVYGRAPLFFYVLHLYLYALMGALLAPYGTGIPRMFPYWLAGLVLLWPLCWAYGRLRQRARPASLWRLL